MNRPLLLALALLVLTLLSSGLEYFLGMTQSPPPSTHLLVNLVMNLVVVLPPLSFAVMGFIVVWRRVKNHIGWVMQAIGLSYGIGVGVTDFPSRAYHAYHLRGAIVVIPALLGNIWGVFIFSITALLLLYPTGTPLSPRWRRVLTWGAPIALVILVVGTLAPGRLPSLPLRNPVGLSFIPTWFGDVAILPFAVLLVAGVAGMVQRFRVSRGEVRQQMKWFTYSAALMVAFFLSAALSNGGFGDIPGAGYFITLTLMPVAIAIAVLKYRLWDIDVLINRTLVYLSVTLSLGAFYLGGVIAMQSVFRGVTGQSSDLAVAVATLAVAAVFNPWRRRLQNWIDQRFYRRKYDATRTLATLGARLRNDMDLPQVTADIESAVHETMQPAHLSIWVR